MPIAIPSINSKPWSGTRRSLGRLAAASPTEEIARSRSARGRGATGSYPPALTAVAVLAGAAAINFARIERGA